MSGVDETDIGDRFAQLRQRFAARPLVTEGTGFGHSSGLRVAGRIFVIFRENEVTVKLPMARVDELVGRGVGARFQPGHARVMRQWLTVPSAHAGAWEDLAEEAFDFVVGGR